MQNSKSLLPPGRACLGFVLALLLLTLSNVSLAAFITVNTTDDESNGDGDCSLREAIEAANNNVSVDACVAGSSIGTDSIFISVTGTITIGNAIFITEQVDLFGPGLNALTLDAQGLSQHFIVEMPNDGDDFDLSGMTLANGRDSLPGGSIGLRRGGVFIFENLRFENNESFGSSGFGGAIGVRLPIGDDSSLLIRRCLFENNVSGDHGGALAVAGFPSHQPLASISVDETRFSANEAADDGGALYVNHVDLIQIQRSDFQANEAPSGLGGALFLRSLDAGDLSVINRASFIANRAGNGGAIQLLEGAAIIENATFSGNTSLQAFGNALAARSDAVVSIRHSSFVDHSLARENDRVIWASNGASVSMGHSIVWSSGAAPDPECAVEAGSGSYTSLGYNIDTSGSCTGHPNDLPMTDPQLAPLSDYGDDTSFLVLQSFLPETTGPVVEGGQFSPCSGALGANLAIDQRGAPRPSISRCDIGALEFQSGEDPVAYELAVSVPSGGGVVTSSPSGIDCPIDCSEGHLNGTSVTLSAQAESGYQFDGWSGACMGTDSCVVSMTTARSVTASFAPISDDIFASRFEN